MTEEEYTIEDCTCSHMWIGGGPNDTDEVVFPITAPNHSCPYHSNWVEIKK